MRGIGSGSINLSGVSGTVNKAYLYWHGPTNSIDPNANATVSFDGNTIIGTNIGFSSDNFWSFSNSQAYRADVTSFVAGNGSYSLANFTKASADVNGASLVVFFNDGDSSNNRDVVLFDGNDSNFDNIFDPLGWDATLTGINYSSGTASLNFGVSDGQTFPDGNLQVNGTTIASDSIFQGNSTPFGTGGPTNGSLWDLKTYDVTSFLTPGLNSLNITIEPVDDALSLIHLGIDLPAGAAPPDPNPDPTQTPEPSSILGLLSLGILGVSSTIKRKFSR